MVDADEQGARIVSNPRALALPRAIRQVRRALTTARAEDVFLYSAALAFYGLISVAPLVVVALWVTSLVVGPTQIDDAAAELARFSPEVLRRRHLDLDAGFVDVRAAEVEDGTEDGTDLTVDRTKSEAGVRVVGLPAVLVPELRAHLARWSEKGPDGRVFVGPKGVTPRRSNFNRAWSASRVRAAADGTPLPEGLHFHDLRQTANEFAAGSASVKELMARTGHSTARAALIYQRARRDREREIAATVSARVEQALGKRAK